MPTSISINETEGREQGQTLDCCSLYSLIPCSFLESVYIRPKLLSLGLVFPKGPSKLDVGQLVQLGLGTWNSPAKFPCFNKSQSPECQQNQGVHNEEKSRAKYTEFSVSALQCKGIQGSLHLFPLFIQKFCLRSSNLLILLTKVDQLNSHISSVLNKFKLD